MTIERSRSYHREWRISSRAPTGASRSIRGGGVPGGPGRRARPPVGDEVYLHELDGFAVRLPDETPARPGRARCTSAVGLMIEVQGPKREFLLPYKKEFVARSTGGARLVVTPPEGLRSRADDRRGHALPDVDAPFRRPASRAGGRGGL